MGEQLGTNTLYSEIKCPQCGKPITAGIGFRAGKIERRSYRLGDKIIWDGPNSRPAKRPPHGFLKTIGYFECENLNCQTWQDCYPQVQEALITIDHDVIADVEVTTYRPDKMAFDILEPKDA